ncbi:TPA: hypothetical protein ACNIH0_003133 [Acinetobacter baumannii]|uniref:Uncharacterized protein n=1 Tax=Acinetobacter baumannii 625974 TaxID=1310607 RepID=A0A009QNL1_ACIBA|nr:hypothetical protein [Acinetobacter baumannii]EXC09083.1 hypothetical protein J506_0863 [Acinetobacter baumannii 625974]KAF0616966.1 hypothetical protein AB71192_03486 [Acinetobacter baumannii]KQK45543.1 hypothetical protein AQ482_14630 [Acinetobacter baumannii]MBF6739238.1 hypothetical protein [Acinetobacter baumannii]MBF6823612.1 hypothetical protein [Acinetobacter baumannii]
MQSDSTAENTQANIQSKFHCKCGGLILPDFDAYKVGDEVNFMVQKRENTYQGKIEVSQKAYIGEITEINGDQITVKASVRTYVLSRYEITPKDAPGPIDYFRIGKCRSSSGQD